MVQYRCREWLICKFDQYVNRCGWSGDRGFREVDGVGVGKQEREKRRVYEERDGEKKGRKI